MGPLPRSLRGLIVALVFAATAAATAWWSASMSAGMPMPGGWIMSMAWMRMPDQSWPGAAAMFAAMWAVMMVAMMLPAVSPVIVHHRRPLRVAAAYLGAWAAVGVPVFVAGALAAAAEMRWASVARAVPVASAVVLVAAAALQLSRWKWRALVRCRDRSCCALGRRPTARDAWRDGARLAWHCTRCCTPLMLALVVCGVMDLRVMALVTAAITAERLAPRPRWIVRGVAAAMVAAGVAMVVRAGLGA